jgi:uncharacterized tellurite resistance protein B-like protein
MPEDRQSDSEALLAEMRAFFEQHMTTATGDSDSAPDPEAQLAAAALALELCRADFEISEDERGAVERAVRGTLGVPEERTRQLISLAEQQVRLGVPLHEFAKLIDERFSPDQKRRVVELLWGIAFADAELKAHEEYLVRKVSERIHVSREDFEAARHRAREHFFGGGH